MRNQGATEGRQHGQDGHSRPPIGFYRRPYPVQLARNGVRGVFPVMS